MKPKKLNKKYWRDEDPTSGVYYYHPSFSDMVDKKCPLILPMPRSWKNKSFFADYFSDKPEFADIRRLMNSRNYVVKQTGVTSRVLSHWFDKKILPEGLTPVEGEWKKFTLAEIAWIRGANKMRDFGLSLDAIALARSWIMQWDEKKQEYPWFEYYLALAWKSDEDPYLVILSDGTAELATTADIENLKPYWTEANAEKTSHLLLISLKALLKEMGIKVKTPERLKTLNNGERKLREMLNKGVREIRMRVRGGKIFEMESEETHTSDVDIRQIGRDIERTGGFGEVTAKYSNGRRQSVAVRKKRRL